MHSSDPSCSGRGFAVLVAVLLVSAAGPGVNAAGAQAALGDQGTIVSNDGRTFPSLTLPLLESPPFRGTGLVPKSARTTAAAPPSGLPPIELGASTASVIGTDERRQVTDTTGFPYRAIVSLVVTYPGGVYSCSGFFIDADTVATAGHCVYLASEGGWATSITAYPGRNGEAAPYGSASAVATFAPQAWVDTEDELVDYGAIKLDTPLGNAVGWLGYGVKLDENLVKAKIQIFGYPADKPPGTMWGTRRKIKGVGPEKIYYKIDTFGGQSGSPVYGRVSNTCQPCAFGVHAYGMGGELFASSNSGTRVNGEVFANLALWAAQ